MKRIARFLSLAFVAMLIALPVHATVSSETTRVKYTCDGTTTVYAYPFKIYENDDILAVKAITSTGAETTLVLNTDYTVSGAGGAGGNVTLTAGSVCGSGYTLTILRNIELTQETDYVDGQAFSAESLESALDKVTLIQQQQEEKIGRAPKLPKTSSITDIALPNPSANNYIGWNAGATNLENKASPVATTATQYEVDALISYGGGTAYTQATILSALTAIGTTNKTTLLLRPGTWVISADADYSTYTNVAWKVPPGALLQIASGKTLTIGGPFEAGLYQVFSGDGSVVFGVASVPVLVPWFATGGVGTAASPWTGWDTKITWAGIEYRFPAGYYSYSSAPDWAKTGIRLIGQGISTVLVFTGTGNCVEFSEPISGINNVFMDGFLIKGTATATNGIFVDTVHRGVLKNIRVTDVSAAGFKSNFSVFWTIDNFRVTNNEGAFAVTPVNGIVIGDVAVSGTAYSIRDPVIEGVSGSGIKIINGYSNVIEGGSSEGNGKGLELAVSAHDNVVVGLNTEGNPSLVSGANNTIIGQYAYDAVPTDFTFDATSSVNKVYGGTYGNIVIESGASKNVFDGIRHGGTWTDSGTETTALSVISLGGIWGYTQLGGKVVPRDLKITASSGTGVTAGSFGHLNRQVHIVTVTYAALSAASLTADKVIATVPNKTKITGIYAETTVPYTGGAVSAATIQVGTSTGGSELIVAHNVLSATVFIGDADAELGTSINRANAVQGGFMPTWDGSATPISVRLTTTGANTNALIAGSTTYYIETAYYGY